MIRIEVVTTGQSGFIVAIETTDREPGTGYDWDAIGTASVVGELHKASTEGEPEKWTAWLWKQAGQYPPLGQHAQAVSDGNPGLLAATLRKRHAAKGAWWQ